MGMPPMHRPPVPRPPMMHPGMQRMPAPPMPMGGGGGDDGPPAKKAKTEENLIPEDIFLAQHKVSYNMQTGYHYLSQSVQGIFRHGNWIFI